MTSSSHCGTHELHANDSDGSDVIDLISQTSNHHHCSINIADNIQAANREAPNCVIKVCVLGDNDESGWDFGEVLLERTTPPMGLYQLFNLL